MHPHLSSDHVLEEVHDLNCHSCVIQGTNATILNLLKNKSFQIASALDFWYIHPTNNHYHCNKLKQLSKKETSMDKTRQVEENFVTVIKIKDEKQNNICDKLLYLKL